MGTNFFPAHRCGCQDMTGPMSNTLYPSDAATQADQTADPLDGRWVLEVNNRIYGPYTGHALRQYVSEGRIAAFSIVARTGQPAGEEDWMQAAADPALAPLFAMKDLVPAAAAQPQGQPAAAPATPAATAPAREAPAQYGPRKSQIDRRAKPTSFNIMIVTDVKSRSSGPLETAIMSLGPAYKISANAWVVHTPSGAPEVVNSLTQHLGGSDRLFVVDATRNRTAWFNMGPETDAKIRQVWKQQN